MRQSVFEHVAGTLTVMAVCRSFGPDLSEGTFNEDSFKELEEYQRTVDPSFDVFHDPMRVISDDGSICGIFSVDNAITYELVQEEGLSDDISISDFTNVIEHDQIISADTKISEVIKWNAPHA